MTYPVTIEQQTAIHTRINAYFDGQRDGLQLYACWKDGVQYVGTCGTTLGQALQDCENKRQESLAAFRVLHY